MSVVQIGLLGIAGVLLAIQLKQQKTEFSIYLCICISCIIFFNIFHYMEGVISTIRELTSAISLNSVYVATLLKMLGVTYVAEFSTNICKDAGCQTIASQIEIFSKLTLVVLSLPILVALLQTIQEFLR